MKTRHLFFSTSLVLSLATIGCSKDNDPVDDTADTEADTDTDTDSDTDTDTDTDSDTDTDTEGDAGGTIEEALLIEIDDENYLLAEESIGFAGDRDFFELNASLGTAYEFSSLSYYYTNPDVVCDTVIRVYDEAGEMIATNDDMPYRFQETDSAISFQATYDGSYYIEVLEWSDWDEETAANGGSSMTYDLFGWTITPGEVEPNDDDEDVADTITDDTIWENWYGSPFTDTASMFYGQMDDEGDVDFWPLVFSEDFDGAFCQFSLWPETFSGWAPEMTLFNEALEPVSQTIDPTIYPTWNFAWNAGITYQVTAGETYYLSMVDQDDLYGPGTFYAGVHTCYNATLSQLEEEGNDEIQFANMLEMTESTATAGFFYTRANGTLVDGDEADNLWIRALDVGGSLNGKFLNVEINAETQGSLLDANVTVYADPGSGEWEELAMTYDHPNNESIDPHIIDLELTQAYAGLVIQIAADDTSAIDAANYWHASVSLSDEAVAE